MTQAVTQSDYGKVIDYLPVRKKNQLIIAYDLARKEFAFSENDTKQLYRMTGNDEIVDETKRRILTDRSLNPQLGNGPKVLGSFLYFLFALVFLLLLYIFIGIFIFFLGDPVICFMYGYFFMYQFWWRGGRVGIELLVESRRGKSLESYLQRQSQRVYAESRLKWSVGGNGKWIQIDKTR